MPTSSATLCSPSPWTDAGTRWLVATNIYVGSNGPFNSLAVSNGGMVIATGFGAIGFNSGANSNIVTVTGPGSVWTNANVAATGWLDVEKLLAGRKYTVFCGHIHEARGIDYIGDTRIVNPGPVSAGHYAVFDVGETFALDVE